MKLETQFSNQQLKRINVQGILYMCSCPSQVGGQIDSLRKLFDYQANCSERSGSEVQTRVHQRIADATQQAHLIMEECLKDVLELEGWDPETLEMPAGLRTLLEQEIDGE
ncbi:hypothetical protein JWZ98_19210 [Methylomonas sp. EFPC1]|uniref:hypothetical protein n=1 Tax=Methylomonas sp. EFPC1 TaxID=2812647 RepID=UPI001966E6AB|nr:hypothetical protein [Methylomonas sp. EFPC1]QSB00759.1 hypothetical protein JWZ98_19210 [Methylomonas sp. EFPC1]